jgi:hypothetical protein
MQGNPGVAAGFEKKSVEGIDKRKVQVYSAVQRVD